MNISLEFRTFEETGLLVYHRFSSAGFVKLFMEDARIKVVIVAADMPKVELDNFDQTYNDGKWHEVQISMAKNTAILTIDKSPMDTRRKLDIATGGYYMIGGGVYDEPGFIGCMRQLKIAGDHRRPSEWKEVRVTRARSLAGKLRYNRNGLINSIFPTIRRSIHRRPASPWDRARRWTGALRTLASTEESASKIPKSFTASVKARATRAQSATPHSTSSLAFITRTPIPIRDMQRPLSTWTGAGRSRHSRSGASSFRTEETLLMSDTREEKRNGKHELS